VKITSNKPQKKLFVVDCIYQKSPYNLNEMKNFLTIFTNAIMILKVIKEKQRSKDWRKSDDGK